MSEGSEAGFVDQFTWLSTALVPFESLDATLHRIAQVAVAFVPGCDTCGISMLVDGHADDLRAATGPTATEVDQFQHCVGEGPCIDAALSGTVVRTKHLSEEDRWPQFVPRALDHGVKGVLSMPLLSDGGSRGALNLYSSTRPFEAAEERAQGLAVVAAVAVEQAGIVSRTRDVVENLETALLSREVIGQAKGIVMERQRVRPDGAFEVLRTASQNQNVKLRELAQRVVDTGSWEPI